jgi:hypothetical protein
MRRRAVAVVVGMAVLLAFLVEAPFATAGYDPVGSGATRLALAKSFTGLLRANGIRLRGTGGVTVKDQVVTFPAVGGKLEPVEARAIVEHGGSLLFQAGSHSLPLRALQLKSSRRTAPYAAKLGGGQLKLATTRALTSERAGFGSSIRAPSLLLSANVATRLDKKLGLGDVFVAGQALGTATTTVEPASVGIVPGGSAEITIDPAFGAKLAGLFVAVNPISPAEHPGAFTLPIGGGALPLSPGIPATGLKTNGAIEFVRLGGGQFFARELAIDLNGSVVGGETQLVPVASPPGPNQVGAIFSLGATTPTHTDRTITVTAAPLTLAAGTAQAFNEAFAKPFDTPDAFAAGELFGSISFSAQGE